MKLTKLKLFFMCLLASSSIAESKEEGFRPLFNGKDLTGWSQVGGTATFVIENGELIGTSAPNTPNSFMVTDSPYDDFELRFEVKIDDDQLNSGCQIRSKRHGAGMQGYQVELEAQHGTAGFIYDELGRGWLSKERVNKAKNEALKKGEWNDVRIVCQGSSIKTWINEVQVADLIDDKVNSGLIGLQVHSVPGDPNWSVRWKDVRIKELLPELKEESTREMSDFETKGNWKSKAQGEFVLKPRKGETGWERFSSYLWSKKEYGDFICSFEYLHLKDGNSGFYFRVSNADDPVQTGIEIQILDSYGKKGPRTHHDNGGVIFTSPASSNMSKPAKEWNKMIVKCQGSQLKVWLNGVKIQDLDLKKTGLKDRSAKGVIGFQDHGLPFKLKNVRIEEL